jgi:hypothetical protein
LEREAAAQVIVASACALAFINGGRKLAIFRLSAEQAALNVLQLSPVSQEGNGSS